MIKLYFFINKLSYRLRGIRCTSLQDIGSILMKCMEWHLLGLITTQGKALGSFLVLKIAQEPHRLYQNHGSPVDVQELLQCQPVL